MQVKSKPPAMDEAAMHEWFPVGLAADLLPNQRKRTGLLGHHLELWCDSAGQSHACDAADPTTRYMTTTGFDYLWVCLGTPRRGLFGIAEAHEADRVITMGGSFGVRASALRMVENFLDMGHFPYVHTGLLGAEPVTEVRDYKAEITAEDEVLVTGCGFYQPQASTTARDGAVVEYTYRIARPTCALLYKTAATQPARRDVLSLFLQPVSEEESIAHFWRAQLDVDPHNAATRSFQQQIFAQDRPILENQLPKRLPLNPRDERHVRSDGASTVYRRWLHKSGFTYGAIPFDPSD